MILRQTFERPIQGYWDGGAKQTFDWSVDGPVRQDKNGQFVRIGSWAANNWFHVSVGKSEKQTLSNARRRLLMLAKRAGIVCGFEYVQEN